MRVKSSPRVGLLASPLFSVALSAEAQQAAQIVPPWHSSLCFMHKKKKSWTGYAATDHGQESNPGGCDPDWALMLRPLHGEPPPGIFLTRPLKPLTHRAAALQWMTGLLSSCRLRGPWESSRGWSCSCTRRRPGATRCWSTPRRWAGRPYSGTWRPWGRTGWPCTTWASTSTGTAGGKSAPTRRNTLGTWGLSPLGVISIRMDRCRNVCSSWDMWLGNTIVNLFMLLSSQTC